MRRAPCCRQASPRRARPPSRPRPRIVWARAPAPPARGRRGIRHGAACRPAARSSARRSGRPRPPRGRARQCRGAWPGAGRRCGAARPPRRRPGRPSRDGPQRRARGRRRHARRRSGQAGPRRSARCALGCRAMFRCGKRRSSRRARSWRRVGRRAGERTAPRGGIGLAIGLHRPDFARAASACAPDLRPVHGGRRPVNRRTDRGCSARLLCRAVRWRRQDFLLRLRYLG